MPHSRHGEVKHSTGNTGNDVWTLWVGLGALEMWALHRVPDTSARNAACDGHLNSYKVRTKEGQETTVALSLGGKKGALVARPGVW